MRSKKLNDLLRDVVGEVLLEEFQSEDDRALVTVTRAEISPTLEHATIYISVLPDDAVASVLAALKRQIYDLQQAVNHQLIMRPVPKIRFELDTTEAHAARIEKLLENDVK